MDYVCIKDCGFYFGDVCSIVSQNDKYIVLENQDKEKNMFTEDEFNKWFKKLIIEDIKHCDKFEKLRDKLNNIVLYPINKNKTPTKATKEIIKDDIDYFKTANEYYKKTDWNKAIKFYKKDLNSFNKHYQSIHNIGVCYIKIKKYKRALYYLFKAEKEYVKFNDETCNILYNIGYCYVCLNNKEKALEYFYKVRELNPKDEDCNEVIKILESDMNK